MELWEDVLIEVTAKQLNITPRDLWGELKDGTTIAEVAAAQNVVPQAIYDAYLVDLAARLDALVAAGRITQEEAEGLLARVESRGWVTASTRAPG